MRTGETFISQSTRFIGVLLSGLPLLASAQAPTDFDGVVELILRFVEMIISFAWIVLFFAFVYGVFKFLTNFDDERAREEGKKSMVFTITAAAVVFMIWGIIALLNNSVFGNTPWGIPFLSAPTAAAPTP